MSTPAPAPQSDALARARSDWRACDLGVIEAENALRLARRKLEHAEGALAEAGGTVPGAAPTKGNPGPHWEFEQIKLEARPIPFRTTVDAAELAAPAPKLTPADLLAGRMTIEEARAAAEIRAWAAAEDKAAFIGPAPADAPEPKPEHAPAGPTWRNLTLEAAGFMQGEDAFDERACEAMVAANVRTCGELADRLLAGELFGLMLPQDIEPIYSAIEMLSEDDDSPIDFDAHFARPRDQSDPPVNVGDVIRTSYGTGPYVVKSVSLPNHPGHKWGLTLRDANPKGRKDNTSWINEVERHPDGRVTSLNGTDEVFVVPSGQPHGPDFYDWCRDAGYVRENGNKELQLRWMRGEPAPDKGSFTPTPEIPLPEPKAAEPAKAKPAKPAPAPTPAEEPASFEVGAKPLPEYVVDVTRLADLDGFPDAVADKLAPAVTTLATLLERMAAGTAGLGDLPLRNKLVAYLVNQNVKMAGAAKAADAVAERVGRDHLFFADVPGFPAAAAVHLLKEHKLRTLADLVPAIEREQKAGESASVRAALLGLDSRIPELTAACAALIDHFGDRFPPAPKEAVAQSEPKSSTEPAAQPSLPFEDAAETPPRDKTAEWEALLDTPAVGGSGQDPKRMRAAIDEFREDQVSGNASPMWSTWSEFDVTLASGDVVRVLSKPFWDRETGRHHVEFWSEKLGPTGYWSVTIDRVSGKGGPLIHWAEAEAGRRAAEYAAEVGARGKKPAAPTPVAEPAKKPAAGEKPYGWAITYSTEDGKEERCHYTGTEQKARRRTLARPKAKSVITCEPLSEKDYVTTFGRGGM